MTKKQGFCCLAWLVAVGRIKPKAKRKKERKAKRPGSKSKATKGQRGSLFFCPLGQKKIRATDDLTAIRSCDVMVYFSFFCFVLGTTIVYYALYFFPPVGVQPPVVMVMIRDKNGNSPTKLVFLKTSRMKVRYEKIY